MKRMLVATSLLAVSAVTLFGQGRVLFNNITSGNAITVISFGPTVYAGGNYSIQLLWAPQASYGNSAAFFAAVIGSSPAVSFFGTTGGSPGTDGAGLFDGGTVPNPSGTSMPPAAYTMMARAWFNGGQFPTYAAAQASGANIGISAFFNIAATAPGNPANTTIFPSFQIGIPEPSTFAIAALGAAGLLLIRRRKLSRKPMRPVKKS